MGGAVRGYFEWWDGRERRVLLLEGDRLTVSRVHAVLQQLSGRWFVEDCGSRNGTSVNGHRLTGMVPLRANDEMRLGRARLEFRGEGPGKGRLTDTLVSRPAVTPRERDVLVALCAPLASGDVFTEPATVREMAASLSVTENAVKLHLANLAGKFGIREAERRRSRLANAALDAGVITLADLRSDHG
jgi:FHA domain